jgi:hypothetical protein
MKAPQQIFKTSSHTPKPIFDNNREKNVPVNFQNMALNHSRSILLNPQQKTFNSISKDSSNTSLTGFEDTKNNQN